MIHKSSEFETKGNVLLSKDSKENCLEEIPFSAHLSELPVQYNLHNFPLVVCNLLSENEILCRVFNLYYSKWILNMVLNGLIITEAKRHRNI